MKIIDILVKISNEEEVPKKIKYQDLIFTYNKEEKDYKTLFDNNCVLSLFNLVYITPFLNEEVEIIEDIPKEDKKIEKISLDDWIEFTTTEDIKNIDFMFNKNSRTFVKKINEIIDKINGDE